MDTVPADSNTDVKHPSQRMMTRGSDSLPDSPPDSPQCSLAVPTDFNTGKDDTPQENKIGYPEMTTSFPGHFPGSPEIVDEVPGKEDWIPRDDYKFSRSFSRQS